MTERLSPQDLLRLERVATPTVANGWEQITARDAARECFNREAVQDFMPELGPMVGYAVTLVVEPSNAEHRADLSKWFGWRDYVASTPGPKIVVVQDLDKPEVLGAFWGEVNSTVHHALGCVGTIVDGGVRDLDEMRRIGFKALARRPCVGHAHVWPVRFDCEVEVFGCPIEPGQLIHADQHGFLAIPRDDEAGVVEATVFMDELEQSTVIATARAQHADTDAFKMAMLQAEIAFTTGTRERFGQSGEFGAATANDS